MPISWHDDTIRWFRDSSAFTGYHRLLSYYLRPVVQGQPILTDIGCGLGLISLELAPLVEHVTCVDVSEKALASLAEDADDKGISNITTLRGDASQLDLTADVMLASYFGASQVGQWLERCRRLICVTTWAHATHEHRKGTDAERLRSRLDEAGIRYQVEHVTLEFGQPCIDRRDAARYIAEYHPGDGTAQRRANLLARLVDIDEPPFTCYLPKQRSMGVFVIEGGRR
ncbi:class I SAM-dependent methyltransferase [Propionibacterium sp.]|uniref:class I SAM-dependent methyltransferase n=1 Tax=Propionibacterium sp. TaxID=1977903 RepID=UPI0039ED7C3D